MASNIETIDHEWVADLWPEPYQFTHALGIAKGDIQVHNYDVVPRTFQGLLAWAFVGHNPTALDMTRTVLLQYLHPPVYPNMPPKIFPVGVRVQGFVDSVNLRPLGNWTRGSSPSSALQHISLSGAGKYEAQFTHYVSAVNNIILFIYRSLNGTPPNDNFLSQNSLFIARRVFTKVTSMNRDMPSMLNAEDDPMQEARFVEDTWKVTEKLNSGMFIADEGILWTSA
ncbi:hypothetical protein R3P38DRAFT_2770617 [Favolaschia claudopus]|uniref:Uncharacterized protein n=1 Tax=Favolaschia claudopus TaxID=2862362 RepID=A0AAW0CHE9_9AGAR